MHWRCIIWPSQPGPVQAQVHMHGFINKILLLYCLTIFINDPNEQKKSITNGKD